jgi:hypothetical protein
VERHHGPVEDPGTDHPHVVGDPDADDPEVKEIMGRAGADTVKTTHEQYRAQIVREIAQWKPLIQEIAERK